MATKNLIPRASGEGGIGIANVTWGDAYFDTGNFNKGLYVSGDSIDTVISQTITQGGLGGKWDDGTTAGEIYYNGGNVGIGTTSPGQKLSLAETSNGDNLLVHFEARNSAANPLNSYIVYDPNADFLALSSSQLIQGIGVDNIGNVGIGTTDPSAGLEIHRPEGDESFATYTLDANGDKERRLRVFSNAHGAVLGLQDGGQDIIVLDGRTQTPNSSFFNGGNVGIGTTNPAQKLEVSGGATSLEYLFLQDVGRTTTDKWVLGTEDDRSLQFNYNGAGNAEFVIASGGNVGIGATNPDAKLTTLIEDDSTYGNIAPDSANSVLALINTPTSEAADNHATLQFNLNAGTHNHVGSISLISESETLRRGALAFCIDNGTTSRPEAMRIDSSGNVGIGTTSPDVKLQVQNGGGNNTYGFQILGNNTDKNRIGGILDTHIPSNDRSAGALALHSSDTTTEIFLTAQPDEANYINNGGNVGIGTSSPDEALHVKTTTFPVQILAERGSEQHSVFSAKNSRTSDNQVYFGITPDGDFGVSHSVDVASSGSFFIKPNGNVGIGTTSPSEILHLREDAPELWMEASGTNGNTYALKSTSIGDFYLGKPTSNGNLSADEANLVIDSSGNLGIGATDPLAKLDIRTKGDTPNDGLIVKTEDGEGRSVRMWVDGSTQKAHIGGGVGTEDLILNHAGGNVGIGTMNPGSKLEVYSDSGLGNTQFHLHNDSEGDAAVLRLEGGRDTISSAVYGDVGQLVFANKGNITAGIKSHHQGDGLITNNDFDDGDLRFYTSDHGSNDVITPRMTITRTGNVGIGTTIPVSEVDISKASGEESVLSITSVGVQRHQIIQKGASDGDGALVFYNQTAGAERMRIASNGNVGIGTTDPGAKLHIPQGTTIGGTDLSNACVLAGNTSTGIGIDNNEIIKKQNNGVDPSGGELNIISQGPAASIKFKTGEDSANNDEAFNRMLIDSAGNVGIGTTDPGSFKLKVQGNLHATGTSTSSDDRVKHNEQPIVDALETLSKITPKKYIKTNEMYDVDHDFQLDADGNPVDENGESVEHRIEAGVIAQQVLTVDELAFAVSPEGVDEDGNVTSPHGLDYNSLFTYAIAAIQEQQKLIEDLRSEVEVLKNK